MCHCEEAEGRRSNPVGLRQLYGIASRRIAALAMTIIRLLDIGCKLWYKRKRLFKMQDTVPMRVIGKPGMEVIRWIKK